MIDIGRLLHEEFKSPEAVIALLSRQNSDLPPASTVVSWFKRNSVPGHWLIRLLALRERELNEAVSLRRFLSH